MGNEAKFTLTIDGDANAAGAIFAAFKRQIRSDVSEIERTTNNVKLFATLDADLKKAAQSVDLTRAALASLTRTVEALRSAGEPVGKEIAKGLADAQRAAAAAEKDFVKQSIAVDKLRTSVQADGVDVNNLAAAEAKLAVEARKAAAAQAEQEAKTATGFKTLRDVKPEIDRIVAGYNALASSGKLSFGELSTLHARAQQQLTQLRSSVTGVGAAFREVRGTIIAFAAAFAGIIAGGAQSAANFRAFSEQIAAVGTIAGVSEAKLAELGAGVRRLSREMGVDAVNSAKALYEIIGSGVSPDNALTVLAEASKAARAGLTDVHTAATVGVGILNGYGLTVDRLEHVYDVLFQTVKDGVVTFPELAANIGTVIPIARAANVPLEQLGAAFVVLTRQGIQAPEAATAIARAIQDLAAPAPEAADKMRELGITFDGLVGTVEQFANKNLSIDQITRLIPDIRAARAVLALSQNFTLLRESLESVSNSAGSMQSAYERMAATPQAKVDRFNSAIKDLSLSVGEFVTNSAGFIQTLTSILNAFNSLGPKTQQTILYFTALAGAVTALSIAIKVLGPAINLLVGSLATASTTTVTLTGAMNAAAIAAGALQLAVAGFVGFKLGEVFYENSAAVRRFGDALGALLGGLQAVAQLLAGTVRSAFTLNLETLRNTWQEFKRNAEIAGGDFVNALTGATEKSRSLAERQAELGNALNKTAKAAGESAGEVDKALTAIISKLDAQAKAVETALSQTQARLTSLVASLTKGVQDITAGAQRAIQNLAAGVSTQLAALSTFDVQKVRETVQIQKDAAVERIKILQQFSLDAVKAFDSEAAARRQIAVKSGEDLKRVDQEIAQARVAVLTSVVEGFRAHVNELLNLERSHLENVRRIEEERRGINQSVEEKIREIRRQGLSEYQQYNDKVRQIDEFTSKARAALAAGDNKLAEDFAQKAISAASSIAGAVKQDGVEVVSASSAASSAIARIQTAQDILNRSLKERADAERDGAAAAVAGLEKAIPLLERYQAELAKAVEKAKEGIKLRVDADVDAVTKAVDDLERQLAERTITLALLANMKRVDEEILRVKADLDKGIPVPLIAKTEAVEAAIKAVRDAKPELNVETTAALAKIEDLKTKAQALEAIKPVIDATVKSNVADVQAQINNLKKPTESTHTVYIKEVRDGGGSAPEPVSGFARGGLVGAVRRFAQGGMAAGAAVQRFARGGGVGAMFRRPTWTRVPGAGSGDTVPALLQAGSFVVRKAASNFYGSGLMGALASGLGVRGYAAGGKVSKEDVENWAINTFGYSPSANAGSPPVVDVKGFKSGDSFQSNPPPVNFDTREIPDALLTAMNVLAYAREMLNSVGQANPMLGSLLPAILDGIRAVEKNPTDKGAVRKLLQAAETIGSNPHLFALWGKTASGTGGAGSAPIWFVDWLKKRGIDVSGGAAKGPGISIDTDSFATKFFGGVGGSFLKNFFGNNPNKLINRRFAEGGGSGDTVRAMLTPGEWVIKKPAVQKYGSAFMAAVNSMMIPRAQLAGMLAAPMPVARFATGGQVGFDPTPVAGNADRGISDSGGNRGPREITVNVYANEGDLLSERNVRKFIVPVIRDILNKT